MDVFCFQTFLLIWTGQMLKMFLSPELFVLSHRVSYCNIRIGSSNQISECFIFIFFCHIWQLWEISSINISPTRSVFYFISLKVYLFLSLWQRIYLSVTAGFLLSVPADSTVFHITFCFILQHQVCFQIQISSPPLDKFNSRCFASMGLFLIKIWSAFSGFIPAEGRLAERCGYVTVTIAYNKSVVRSCMWEAHDKCFCVQKC